MKKRVKRHVVIQPEDKGIRLIALSRGMNAIVDADLYVELDAYNWSVHRSPDPTNFYAGRCVEGKTCLMHRIVIDAPEGMEVDHINGNGLDNRRSNLRLATRAENNRNHRLRKDNRSGVKGVFWSSEHSKWRAGIHVNKKRIELGLFRTLEDAAEAYRKAADEHHKEFSPLRRTA